jgi:hypothetical protein
LKSSIISGILLLLGAIAISPSGDFNQVEDFPKFCLGSGIMCLGFVCSWRSHQLSAWWFWLVAIATRGILLFMYPGDDIWRYLWEGYIQTLGFSPYDFAPNAPELIPYHTAWWTLINHQTVSAIYPPMTQLGFRILASITPQVWLFKTAFIIADLLICWLLTRRFSYWQTTLYAWNPLVIYSFAGGGHYDSWLILPLVVAWLIEDLKHWQRAILIGISVAIKWISLPILGFITWQTWRIINVKTAIIIFICGLLPIALSASLFCNFDQCYLIPTSSNFVDRGRSAEFIPYLLAKIWQGSRQSNNIFAIPLGLAVIFLTWQAQNLQQFARGYFFVLLTLSPIVHGWYFTWIIPFAVATQNWGVRLLSISAFIYFVLPHRQALGNPNWRLNAIETLYLWLPFVCGYFSGFLSFGCTKLKL